MDEGLSTIMFIYGRNWLCYLSGYGIDVLSEIYVSQHFMV